MNESIEVSGISGQAYHAGSKAELMLGTKSAMVQMVYMIGPAGTSRGEVVFKIISIRMQGTHGMGDYYRGNHDGNFQNCQVNRCPATGLLEEIRNVTTQIAEKKRALLWRRNVTSTELKERLGDLFQKQVALRELYEASRLSKKAA